MYTFPEVLSGIASLVTILMFAVPYRMTRRIFEVQHTLAPILPAVATVVNCVLWMSYGYLIDSVSMIACNIVGVIVGSYTVSAVLTYGVETARCWSRVQVALGACVIALIFGYMNFASRLGTTPSDLVWQVGLCCAIASVAMFAAPLVEMKHVLTTRTPGSLSPLLVGISLTASAMWLTFGALTGNLFVVIPNTVACILCLIQAWLILIVSPAVD